MTQQADKRQSVPRSEQPARRDALNDGIGYRRIARPANDAEITTNSPWALAPWPTLEVTKWLADRFDRLRNRRRLSALKAAENDDPQAQLQTAMHEGVIPALREVRDRFAGEGYDVSLDYEAMGVVLAATGFNGRRITYRVSGGLYKVATFALADFALAPDTPLRQHARLHIESRGRMRNARPRHCGVAAVRRDALHEVRTQLLY